MAIVSVTFKNYISGESASGSQVDDSMTVRETIEHLRQSAFPLPPLAAGQHYVLEIKGKTELGNDDLTLQSGGVKDGDVITIVPAQRGGCL